jgi:hypothetical protein
MTVDRDLALVTALDASLLNPDVRGSRDQLEALLASEFLEFGRSGRTYTKHQILELLADDPAKTWGPVIVSDLAARALSETVFLVTYVSSQQGRTNRAPLRTNRSSVWTRRCGRWQLVLHQGTPADDPS